MLYAKLKDGEIENFPIREADLRKVLANISFPSGEILNEQLVGTDYIAIPHNPEASIPLPTADKYTAIIVFKRTASAKKIRDRVTTVGTVK